MHDWQQRVVEERDELQKKIDKLDTFIHHGQLTMLSNHEQKRLIRQLVLMELYRDVLNERIAFFDIVA